jgi:hypothetical protein
LASTLSDQIDNRQSAIGNLETHPLPRRGTDCMSLDSVSALPNSITTAQTRFLTLFRAAIYTRGLSNPGNLISDLTAE